MAKSRQSGRRSNAHAPSKIRACDGHDFAERAQPGLPSRLKTLGVPIAKEFDEPVLKP